MVIDIIAKNLFILENRKLIRILEELGFAPIGEDEYGKLVPTNAFIANTNDNPGCPLPDDKKALLVRAVVREKSHTLVCCVTSLLSNLDDKYSTYSMMSVNASLMGCKLAKFTSDVYLVSSFNWNLYRDCNESLIKEAIADLRSGADLAYRSLRD